MYDPRGPMVGTKQGLVVKHVVNVDGATVDVPTVDVGTGYCILRVQVNTQRALITMHRDIFSRGPDEVGDKCEGRAVN
jgi:hypothetical protein